MRIKKFIGVPMEAFNRAVLNFIRLVFDGNLIGDISRLQDAAEYGYPKCIVEARSGVKLLSRASAIENSQRFR